MRYRTVTGHKTNPYNQGFRSTIAPKRQDCRHCSDPSYLIEVSDIFGENPNQQFEQSELYMRADLCEYVARAMQTIINQAIANRAPTKNTVLQVTVGPPANAGERTHNYRFCNRPRNSLANEFYHRDPCVVALHRRLERRARTR